ncbi:hypothetical protein A5M85_12315 [Cellulophaga lytica]|uniref:PQQ-binding-like beta-propeller repeat protein n=1 Tax=Cellulophaga lytica TaxID=979 RepID=UPI0009504BC2|nr:PQQ-binding-like beta-propeller repeat protein [Cellulophaga lytica]APU11040.1 hypothetical protein A5M85_12315 [Cellulophaga lytica]
MSVCVGYAQVNKNNFKDKGIVSIETGYTITKVRTAINKTASYIVATSFEGTIIGVSYDGNILWKNKLSGFMNHDIWCQDINNDNVDEILAANADGTIYCLNNTGKLLWKFKQNSAPMYAVCAVKKGAKTYVVGGGFDKSIYYISSGGEMVKEIKSSTYSIEKPWAQFKKDLPESNVSTANFIRPIPQKNGDDVLAVLGTNNHMNVPGTMYLFNPLEDKPYRKDKIAIKGKRVRVIGHFTVDDYVTAGEQMVILGTSSHTNDSAILLYNPQNGKVTFHKNTKLPFGYDVTHTVTIKKNNRTLFLTRVRNQIKLLDINLNEKTAERLIGKYAYYDVWKDPKTNLIILASSQSGGSAIHIINTKNDSWKKDFKTLDPPGKIQTIIANTKQVKGQLNKYKSLKTGKKQLPVYLMTEKITPEVAPLKKEIEQNYTSPVFLNSKHLPKVENWDRSDLANEKYRKKRDRRKKYVLTQQQALSLLTKEYKNAPGLAYWAGHGNDPYMFSLATTKKVLDAAKGKKTVLIYPEMEDHSKDFEYVVNDLIYPLADYAKDKNTNIFLRSKNVFWLGSNYLDAWSGLMSGSYADVFVPSMEETTDKTMELSLAGRTGIWASGAVNGWGTRAVPDNTAFDRSRQYGAQQLPNHFLRMLIFHTANGAQYINNFPVDQEYISLYWKLIAKGVLYVPKREEIVSFSPVHLSMKSPNKHFLDEGSSVKWTVKYNEEFEKNNPFVFSRMNGSWPGAPVTKWDFSRYAAGVKERRLNFLAPYNNGLVLITPPQQGVFATKNVVRSPLKNNLHPLYKNILKEYITDGHSYFSKDGKQTYSADTYYKTIESSIKQSAKLLPISVEGDVAWVVAQIAPKKLRLTLIDSGYLNPSSKQAIIHFNTIKPTKILDILTKETFAVNNATTTVTVPLGLFRFIDVEIDNELK